ncbi:hypothetical protein [Cellulomonas persica]|uniref:hypothetical protein n=1 Tax=Cellulomonas persica TaxID=76861 RepID=UPI001649CAA6|nr:hypothetical protein [Cellulomonas persica]
MLPAHAVGELGRRNGRGLEVVGLVELYPACASGDELVGLGEHERGAGDRTLQRSTRNEDQA